MEEREGAGLRPEQRCGMRRAARATTWGWTALLAAVLATGVGAAGSGPGEADDPVRLGLVSAQVLIPQGLTLLEVSKASCPASSTLSPRLARHAAESRGLVHHWVELGPWDGERARRSGIDAVPAFFLYRDGVLVERGTRALRTFTRDPGALPPAPPPVALASVGDAVPRSG